MVLHLREKAPPALPAQEPAEGLGPAVVPPAVSPLPLAEEAALPGWAPQRREEPELEPEPPEPGSRMSLSAQVPGSFRTSRRKGNCLR